MIPFLRKHRELVIVALLLLLPFGSYVSHAQGSFSTGPVRDAVVAATAPVQKLLLFTADGTRSLWSGYLDLRFVNDRNEALSAELGELRNQVQRLGELEAENARLRRMVSFVEAQPEVRMVAAPVVGLGPDSKFRGIRIGRGSSDGLVPGMAVVTPDGVVGRLLNVYGNVSDVLLVIDPQSAVAVLSQRTRARASARGLGDTDTLRLDYLVKSDDLAEGDLLVTAPSGGLFPKGLRVGRATNVSQPANGLFKSADLIPSVDFSRLDEVLVVVDNGPSAAVTSTGSGQAFIR